MSEISRFYGIVIYMYYSDTGRHSLPHFHAKYNGYEASIALNPPRWLAGAMPKRQMNLVLAWAELHHDELWANWKLMRDKEKPAGIEGLQ